jgi:Leucine-rich repeat (LRR) protein
MKFSALKKLELQSNNIKEIQQLKQSKLPELEELYLDENSFTEMHSLSLPKLKILSLQNLK